MSSPFAPLVSERVRLTTARHHGSHSGARPSDAFRRALASPTGGGKTLAFAILAERERDARPADLAGADARSSPCRSQKRPRPSRSRLAVATAYGEVGIRPGPEKAARSPPRPRRAGSRDLLRRRLVRLDGVSLLVLDEADRMLDGLPGRRSSARFAGSARLLLRHARRRGRPPRSSHTLLTPCASSTRRPGRGGRHRASLPDHAHEARPPRRRARGRARAALVFVRTKRREPAGDAPRAVGFVAALHGDMTRVRARSLEAARGHADPSWRPTSQHVAGHRASRHQLRPAGRRSELRAPRRSQAQAGRNGTKRDCTGRPARGPSQDGDAGGRGEPLGARRHALVTPGPACPGPSLPAPPGPGTARQMRPGEWRRKLGAQPARWGGSDVELDERESFDVDQAPVSDLERRDHRQRREAERHERGRGRPELPRPRG